MTAQPDAPLGGRSVIAVVVTFNRLALLQRLVARLERCPGSPRSWSSTTPRPTARGSGSPASDDDRVRGRTLAENRGGAGGFHDGLAWAVERGADLVWLMDDDGLPDPDCLELLLAEHGPRLLGPARRRRGRPRAGWCSRSGCPAAPGSCTELADVERAADRRPDRRDRDPVQRGAGDPRRWSSGSGCPARSSSSGATTTSTGCAPRPPAPGSPPSSTRRSGTRASTTSARR